MTDPLRISVEIARELEPLPDRNHPDYTAAVMDKERAKAIVDARIRPLVESLLEIREKTGFQFEFCHRTGNPGGLTLAECIDDAASAALSDIGIPATTNPHDFRDAEARQYNAVTRAEVNSRGSRIDAALKDAGVE